MGKEKNLSDRHKRFVDEYLINGFNGTQAYISVYGEMDRENAGVSSSRLLNNVNIIEYLESEKKRLNSVINRTKEDNIRDLIDILNTYKDDGKTVNNSLKAIEIINKMLGWNEPDKQSIDFNNLPPLFPDVSYDKKKDDKEGKQ